MLGIGSRLEWSGLGCVKNVFNHVMVGGSVTVKKRLRDYACLGGNWVGYWSCICTYWDGGLI